LSAAPADTRGVNNPATSTKMQKVFASFFKKKCFLS